jgi:manganese-dependent inorganic pyrophosphatase
MQKVLVTSYICPDVDGTACAYAYAEFLNKTGVEAEAKFMGVVHEEAMFVINKFNLTQPQIITDTFDYQKVVLVDASELSVLENKFNSENVVEVIDHGKNDEADKFPNAKIQIELVGSAATLIAEKFMINNIPISESSAKLLLSAIISNTLNFRNSITTERDIVAGEWLQEFAELPDGFWREQFVAKSDVSGEKLGQKIDADFATFQVADKLIGVGQMEIFGVEELVSKRRTEILEVLKELKSSLGLAHVFISFLELENPKNYILTDDVFMQEKLSKALDINFVEDVAERSAPLMRKQIIPLLKAEILK